VDASKPESAYWANIIVRRGLKKGAKAILSFHYKWLAIVSKVMKHPSSIKCREFLD
jgi:hypothetical protein